MLAPTDHEPTIPCASCGHGPWGHGVADCHHKGCECSGYDYSQGVLL